METISFRYDQKVKKELDYIRNTLQFNRTQAIKEAIHTLYYNLKRQKTRKSPAEIFLGSGFIGSFCGEKDLSATYKKELTKSWSKNLS